MEQLPPRSRFDVSGGAIIGGNYSGNSTVTVPPNGLLVEGNMGIGTTSPQANLEVNNTLVFTPTTIPAFTSKGAIYYNDTEGVLKYYNGTVWKKVGSPELGGTQEQISDQIKYNGRGGKCE